MGRATQGVKVMNIKDDDLVSAVALVVESSADVSAALGETIDYFNGRPDEGESFGPLEELLADLDRRFKNVGGNPLMHKLKEIYRACLTRSRGKQDGR